MSTEFYNPEPTDPVLAPQPTVRKSKRVLYAALAVLVIFFAFVRYILPPADFPTKTSFRVEDGMSLTRVAQELEAKHVIHSPLLFQTLQIGGGTERRIIAGDYYFDRPLSVFEVARRFGTGDFHITPVKVTLPEGYRLVEMATTLDAALPFFNTDEFFSLTKGKEGYLFPDTYFFSPAVTTEQVVDRLEKKFESVMNSFDADIRVSKHSPKDILIMASLIEKEARGADDRNIISGILWKRIDEGMRLQVDATFLYINGKDSKDLTRADLAIDSPYNTYVHKGLPPTPIANPGEASIEAALNPEVSPYYFYLHGDDGRPHFAKTYAEHLKNKSLYIK